jgi:hypothetical protein
VVRGVEEEVDPEATSLSPMMPIWRSGKSYSPSEQNSKAASPQMRAASTARQSFLKNGGLKSPIPVADDADF